MRVRAHLMAMVTLATSAVVWSVPPAAFAATGNSSSACQAPQCITGSVNVGGETIGYDVVLPAGYSSTSRRFPVVYLLHGGLMNQNAWLNGGETGLSTVVFGTGGDVEQFLNSVPANEQAIVVLPASPGIGAWLDWADGAHEYQRALVKELIPTIDAGYRTMPGRAHRAIAGLSAGGFGALLTAARNPDLFSAVGSFSGLDDIANPEVEWSLVGAGTGVSALCVVAPQNPVSPCPSNPSPSDVTGLGPFGDPLANQVLYQANNPGDLAENLRGMSIWLSSGSGIPCDLRDSTDPGAEALEGGLIRPSQLLFDAYLDDADVAYTSVLNRCGVHTWPYWDTNLAQWWPIMLRSLGGNPPHEVDYRSTDSTISVWGWNVQTDPHRAREFLDLTNAGPAGFTLTGSGLTSIVTPPLFPPTMTVGLQGATEPSAIADDAGRLHLRVNLGPSHTAQEYTIGSLAQSAADARAGRPYMTTQAVTFAPSGSPVRS